MLGKKLNTVDEVLSKFSTAIFELENLSDLKHQIDDKYSYGELRLVLQEIKPE